MILDQIYMFPLIDLLFFNTPYIVSTLIIIIIIFFLYIELVLHIYIIFLYCIVLLLLKKSIFC